ncbi:MAG: sensor histidine kinase [Mobilicoccus sp.]|nr:sensor histidine kinase [Mobilicoccus sp.]
MALLEAPPRTSPGDIGGTVAPFVLLGMSLGTASVLVRVAPEHVQPDTTPWLVGLSVLAGIVRFADVRHSPHGVAARRSFWSTWALTAVLVLLNPAFGLYAFIGYPDAARRLPPRESTVGLVAVAIVCALAQTGGLRSPLFTPGIIALFVAVNLVVAGSMALFDRERQRAADALALANAELRAARDHNAALTAQLVDRAREAGIEQERARLAREIHDTVAQDLVAVITQLGVVSDAVARWDTGALDRLRLAETTARGALAEARRSVHALSSPRLDAGDLPAAIERLLHDWRNATGAAARLLTHGSVQAGPTADVALRIVQEALANVAQHAEATVATIVLTGTSEGLTVEVVDDGIGLDTTRLALEESHGIRGMRARAADLGGILDVSSTPGAGTAVKAELPWRAS